MLPPVLLVVGACGGAPSVVTVAPAVVDAGSAFEVRGERFDAGVAVELVGNDGQRVAATNVTVGGPQIVSAVVPEDLPAGVYTVIVDVAGAEAVRSDALVVRVAPPTPPCSGEFRSNTQVSLRAGLATVDRFYRNGDRRTVRVPIDRVDAVELVHQDVADVRCSAIYLHEAGGARVLFEDSTTSGLEGRAARLARDLGRPLEALADAGSEADTHL